MSSSSPTIWGTNNTNNSNNFSIYDDRVSKKIPNSNSSLQYQSVSVSRESSSDKNSGKILLQNYSTGSGRHKTSKHQQDEQPGKIDQIASYLCKKIGLYSYSTELLERNWE